MKQYNILVFPCGSEIGLEIHRALKNSIHFKLIGGSSVNDHGRFVFENYIDKIPFIDNEEFLPTLKKLTTNYKIDAIYPTMDKVIEVLKKNEEYLCCKVISSSTTTTEICLSKSKTYELLKDTIKVPVVYNKDNCTNFPVFVKPDVGYGSRGAKTVKSKKELLLSLEENPSLIISEFLPGEEYTVDCFTDSNKNLLFVGPRKRARTMNGISVNTIPIEENKEMFYEIAEKINSKINFRGAWFFQLKEDENSQLTLLEVASRFAGSSSLFRAKGINFPLLSLFDSFDIPVSIIENNYLIEMDRALNNKYKLNIDFNEVFVDFDDCLFSSDYGFNTDIMKFIFSCKNKKIRINLISRHEGDLLKKLKELQIFQLFDEIFHLTKFQKKSSYITNKKAIFIDDSFSERDDVFKNCKIPVFSVDMVEVLV